MADRGKTFEENFMGEVLHRGLTITLCQGEEKVQKDIFQ